MRLAILLGFCTLVPCAAFAQQQADVAGILKKVAETYRVTKRYVLEGETKGRGSSGHFRVVFEAPNHYRIEGMGMLSGDPGLADGVILDDGSAVWVYLPNLNQYGSFSIGALTDDALRDLGDLRPEAVDHFMMSRFRDATDYTDGAKLLREEAVEIAAVKVNCLVLQLTIDKNPAVYIWWVDKNSRILREDHAGTSALFTTVTFNEPIPENLFKFTPPPGAKKIELQP